MFYLFLFIIIWWDWSPAATGVITSGNHGGDHLMLCEVSREAAINHPNSESCCLTENKLGETRNTSNKCKPQDKELKICTIKRALNITSVV